MERALFRVVVGGFILLLHHTRFFMLLLLLLLLLVAVAAKSLDPRQSEDQSRHLPCRLMDDLVENRLKKDAVYQCFNTYQIEQYILYCACTLPYFSCMRAHVEHNRAHTFSFEASLKMHLQILDLLMISQPEAEEAGLHVLR